MVAIMDEALELEMGHKVLEIGAGCGWHAATVAEIVAPSNKPREKWGHVYTIERVGKLVELARNNLLEAGYGERVTVIVGDGSEGYATNAPYHRISVAAAAPYIPPPLKEQLIDGGIMLIPVGSVGFYQTLISLRRIGGEFQEENLGGVAFVPLVGKYGHRI